ncbi:hypothetical protein PanWU01x14_333180 [Parasponia andersonii]|uniref:Uncharacterized protein n=1 Tax=Parasponia andersonii TaxID=3476 RepID=A0A2P5AGY3_PARAD|nr:hypothetical protein PanWU01x14_333180 [Parasponia andersonii]
MREWLETQSDIVRTTAFEKWVDHSPEVIMALSSLALLNNTFSWL